MAHKNSKLDLLRKFCRDIKADVVALQELQVNWDLTQQHEKLYDLLGSEVKTRVVTGHNVHERNQ